MITETSAAALEPLRAALLANARAEGEALRYAAREQAATLVSTAHKQATAEIAAAREGGLEQARVQGRSAQLLVARERRRDELSARREMFDDLVLRSRAAVTDVLRDETARQRLTELLRRRMGPRAEVLPTPDGGLLARSSTGDTMDASVGALVDQALSLVDLEPLWSGR